MNSADKVPGAMSRRRIIAAALLLAGAVTGTLVSTPASAQANAPIKIGVLLPFSGPAAFQATSSMIALRMGVKEINDAGGLLGRKLELVQADDQFNPAQSVNEARRLLQLEKVNFVMGPMASSLALAVAPIFNE